MKIAPPIDIQSAVSAPYVTVVAPKMEGFAQVLAALTEVKSEDVLPNISENTSEIIDPEEETAGEIEEETENETLEVVQAGLVFSSQSLMPKQSIEPFKEMSPLREQGHHLTTLMVPHQLIQEGRGALEKLAMNTSVPGVTQTEDLSRIATSLLEERLTIKNGGGTSLAPVNSDMSKPVLTVLPTNPLGPSALVQSMQKFELSAKAIKTATDGLPRTEATPPHGTKEIGVRDMLLTPQPVARVDVPAQLQSGKLIPVNANVSTTTADDGTLNSLFSTAIGEVRSTTAFTPIPVSDTRAISQLPPNSIAQQVAVAVRKSQGGVTELVLNPEELGRVRLAINTNDGVMAVTITTERAETQDLMRRHIEALAQEMRALGYNSVGFSFVGQGGGNHQDQGNQDHPVVQDASPEDSINPPMAAQSGLDLRL